MKLDGFSPDIQNCIEELQARRALSGDPGEAGCQRLLSWAAEEGSDVLFGLGYYFFAEHCLHESHSEGVFHCLTEGMKYFRKAGMFDYLAKAYNMMGAVAETQNNRVAALDCYDTCIQYAVEYGYTYVNAMAESNIAGILLHMKRYGEALEMTESSISHYRSAERTAYTDWNMALCLARSGQCHIGLGDQDGAADALRELEALLAEHPDSRFPWFGIHVFRAGCYAGMGDEAEADRCLELLLEELAGDVSLIEFSDGIVETAGLVTALRGGARMRQFLDILEKRGMDDHPALALEIYPYRIKYLTERRLTREAAACAGKYFRMYDRYRQESRREGVKVVELREKLRAVEKEQESVMAYHQKLQFSARRDSMTGLANRTYLNEYLSERFEEAYREEKLLGVELLDIDCFKKYNDTYGHLSGDACIGMVADVLKSVGNERIFCARYGGDEFMVVYSDMTVEEIRMTAQTIARRVLGRAVPHGSSGCAETVTVSQGIFCRVPSGGNREWDFAAMADTVLYEVKRGGRNGYRLRTEFGGSG